MHIRQQIKNKVKEILTDLPTTKKNVFVDFQYPITQEKYPCIIINTGTENIDYITLCGEKNRVQTRTLSLQITAYCKEIQENSSEKIEQIVLEIEKALNDPLQVRLEGIVTQVNQTSIDYETDGALERPIFAVSMSWDFIYKAKANTTDVTYP